jgi:L-threonylcarbamoyladenylate synthase
VSYFTDTFDAKVVELLKNGAVGLLPTDTIYGLSALALNKEAVERIHALKGRDNNKPLIVLISDLHQLEELGLKVEQAELAKSYWPGPLSLEFDATDAPDWLHRGGFFFAVRMPDYSELRDLIAKTGPVVSTSANLQGQKPVSSVKEAQETFGDKLDFAVDAGKLEGQSSTLVKPEDGRLVVVRQGVLEIKS